MRTVSKMFHPAVAAAALLVVTACQSDSAPGGPGGGNGGGDGNLTAQLRLATLEQGSTWHAYGAILADQWHEDHPGVQTQVQPFAGGVANLDLVEEGEAELGLTFSSIASWAHSGEVGFDEPREEVRAIMGGFDEYFVGIVAREDYPAETLADVAEQELPLNLYVLNPGSAGEYLAQATLDAYGLSYEEIESFGGSVQQTSFDVITSAFADGEADMMIQVITENHPATTEIATTNDIKLLPVEEDIYEGVADLGLNYSEIPAGSFQGQDDAVAALSLTTLLITHADQPDELIYGLTESLVENSEEIASQNAALAEFDPEIGASEDSVPIPFHPGAEAYLQDAGLLD